MNERITFVDPVAPSAYSGAFGALTGLGGTEATLVRVCEALADRWQILIRQRARQGQSETVNGILYSGFDPKSRLPESPRFVVVVNSWKVALKLARLHPEAKVIVWLHVFPGRHNRAMGPALKAAGIQAVCVSDTQARWLRMFFGASAPSISCIYNPIPDQLVPDATARDPELLLFASSPHKGLEQVYRRFVPLRRHWPKLRLAVADPGYLAWPTGDVPAGVELLGRLDHKDLIGWMRRSLCLFYPQDHFAETFGLVIAEANAVGCPALLHRGLGANDEVASDPGQCIDTTRPEIIASIIKNWRERPPRQLAARADFRLSVVVAQWSNLLESEPMRNSELDALSG